MIWIACSFLFIPPFIYSQYFLPSPPQTSEDKDFILVVYPPSYVVGEGYLYTLVFREYREAKKEK
ncbi:hypothetical protein DRN97_01390 [Methanosarcinales archaeon]|nr:MAG: hypothetical protein DRN97_01390 [Methanosarcinales archaeon]